jgi:hypothetical protein
VKFEGRQRTEGQHTMSDQADRTKLAAKIQKLLAQAEGEAAVGNEAARDTLLAKASALQLKYAIEDAMLAQAGSGQAEEIMYEDFCRESNTPLIKAKRELIAVLAQLHRGRAVLMPEWQLRKDDKGMKLNRRAYVRVYAHESDLRFINQLYTSLVLQMQTMMANDERVAKLQAYRGGTAAGWRVSYAYGWVGRVYARLRDISQRNEAAEETGTPGTALVLKDRSTLVKDHVDDKLGKLKNTKYRRDDADDNGRAAGRRAADQADIGQDKVSSADRPRLQARRCEARARKGTGVGTCNRPLDDHGQCDRASDHFVQA